MKIASPGLQLTLIESNKKKCAFLSEVVRSLELENVEILPIRFNEIAESDLQIFYSSRHRWFSRTFSVGRSRSLGFEGI